LNDYAKLDGSYTFSIRSGIRCRMYSEYNSGTASVSLKMLKSAEEIIRKFYSKNKKLKFENSQFC